MAENHKPNIDSKDIQDTRAMWAAFVQGGKYAIIITCLVLVGLALAFVKFT